MFQARGQLTLVAYKLMDIRSRWRILIVFLLISVPAFAHLGSPDVYYEGTAGPYHVLVVIRPPAVVPGVAQIEVRNLGDSGDINGIQILPLTMLGPGASLAPRPDAMHRAADDPRVYNGNLWLMLRGSWKVQLDVEGRQGKGEVAVPVSAVSMTAERMTPAIGTFLGGFGLLLVVALVSIIKSANGQALIPARATLTAEQKHRSLVRAAIGAFFIIAILTGGYIWWGFEARANDRMVYRIPHLTSSLQPGGKLQVQLENPNARSFISPDWEVFWAQKVSANDLVPDHGHLMHLFLVRMPDMKSFWHLHPETSNFMDFAASLPTIPPGHYQIYADIVHSTGFPETQVATIDLPPAPGQPLHGDDSGGEVTASDNTAQLSDGYRMVWERETTALRAQQAAIFRFRVEDKNGKPAGDLENYMGMAGHAVFMSDDGKVFAHIHPEGSISMAALSLAQADSGGGKMPEMHMPLAPEVSFPYGFPRPGDYHLFVQVKRAGHVETGVFVAHVL